MSFSHGGGGVTHPVLDGGVPFPVMMGVPHPVMVGVPINTLDGGILFQVWVGLGTPSQVSAINPS